MRWRSTRRPWRVASCIKSDSVHGTATATALGQTRGRRPRRLRQSIGSPGIRARENLGERQGRRQNTSRFLWWLRVLSSLLPREKALQERGRAGSTPFKLEQRVGGPRTRGGGGARAAPPWAGGAAAAGRGGGGHPTGTAGRGLGGGSVNSIGAAPGQREVGGRGGAAIRPRPPG